jgi:hypothetical protein
MWYYSPSEDIPEPLVNGILPHAALDSGTSASESLESSLLGDSERARRSSRAGADIGSEYWLP